MSFWWPHKRVLMAVHRWLGILAALFLFILAVTGLALNHTERLGLDEINMEQPFILHRYGMATAEDIRSFRVEDSSVLSCLEGQLYLNSNPVTRGAEPIGILKAELFVVIATREEIILMTPKGDFIEKISTRELPMKRLKHIALNSSGEAILVAEDGVWKPGPDWLGFHPTRDDYEIIPMEPVELSNSEKDKILNHFQGEGVSLYRVLLDLHSGRLFGWGGRTLMDLSAIAILLLISSGITGWLRNPQRVRVVQVKKQ